MRLYLILLFFSALSGSAFAQNDSLLFEHGDWFNLDIESDQIPGASVDEVYSDLLKGKVLAPVIVAVLDGGVDITHPEFEGKIWTNEGEISGNGVDDDNNGYIDDVHGWNFLGNADGANVDGANLEITRLYKEYKEKFQGMSQEDISKDKQGEFRKYQKYEAEYNKQLEEVNSDFSDFAQLASVYKYAQDLFAEKLHNEEFTLNDLIVYETGTKEEEDLKSFLLMANQEDLKGYLADAQEYFESRLNYHLSIDTDPFAIVNEDKSVLDEKGYGNNMVDAGTPDHGTHVAGIIGAKRNNGIGIDGIASNAIIMPVRMVPDGDERDKDVANAIKYAVDNGANIINMSFGKAFSPHSEYVYEAIAYAADHNVLMVHAAGNENSNNDRNMNYPNGRLKGRKNIKSWIGVGATSYAVDTTLLASFSNYGKKSVDILAPGQDIASTLPDNTYDEMSGTSMAAPVVSGVAALVWGAYPDLSAEQLKKLLIKSGINYKNVEVLKTENGPVKLKKVVRNPVVINAREAIEAGS